MTKKTKPFSRLLAEHISENYRERSFTSIDLESFGKQYHKDRSFISKNLREFWAQGKLQIVGEIPKKQGGSSVKVYEVVEDASFDFVPLQSRAAEYQRSIAEKHKIQTEACLRLCKALDIMTVSR